MTGLFTRLAAQTVEPAAPRVRSTAALPFAPAPVLAEAPGLLEAPAAPATERARAAPTRPEPLVTPAAPVAALPEAREPSTGMPLPEAARGAESTADAATRQPDAPPGAAPVGMTLHEVVTRLVATPGPRPNPRPAEREPRQPPPSLPEPLLAEARVEPMQAQTSRATARDGAASATAPEVHVHIGRIEVTSVAEASAPPAPRMPKRTPPMSLGQYLDKRRGS